MKHNWFICMLISLAMFLAAIVCVMVMLAGLVCWPWQLSWPQTEGQVTNVDLPSKTQLRFTYEYSVEGRPITSWAFQPRSLSTTVKEGSKVTIRYNPKNSNDSWMQCGFDVVSTPFYAFLSVCFFLGAFFNGKNAVNRLLVNDSAQI